MVQLHFAVKIDLVFQGKIYPSMPNPTQKLSLSAWIGGKNNQQLAHTVLDPTDNSAEIKLDLNSNDVDTIKFQQNIDKLTPMGTRSYCLASSWMPISTFCDLLAANKSKCTKCFCMASNFEANAAILYISNCTTNLDKVRSLTLQPSILHETAKLNSVMNNVCSHLQQKVCGMNIPLETGAPQFIPMNTNTFLPMQQVQSAYPILPALFHNIKHNIPIDLAWPMYDMYQTIHNTNLHPDLLMSMSDRDFVTFFACPALQNRCNCALTSPYDSDLTCDAVGNLTLDTEEISRTFSQLAFATQILTRNKVKSTYEPLAVESMSMSEMAATLTDARNASVNNIQPRLSIAACLDDCENTAQGLKLQHTALKQIYKQVQKSQDNLLTQMCLMAQQYPNLFSQLTKDDHKLTAPILFRMCKLAGEEKWNTAMTVVTARNRMMEAGEGQSMIPNLAGHGVCMSQIIEKSGKIHYSPMEGTTSMKVQPCNQTLGRTQDLTVLMADGQTKNMTLSDYATIFGQNVHAVASISQFATITANLPDAHESDTNWMKSPFYVGAFYSGFMLDKNSLGCMPCTYLSSNNIHFGAPVVCLGQKSTFADPITADVTGMDKESLQNKLTQQADEVWPPFATSKQMKEMMSCWAPVQPLVLKRLRTQDNYKQYLTTMVSCAFDRPDHRAMALVIYSKLAEKFNENQRKREQDDDGHRFYVTANYLSVCLNIALKLPPDGQPVQTGAITTLRNTIQDLNLTNLTTCPVKRENISKRMNLASLHPIYVCDKTKKIVHAFNHKLT